ncbi:phage tail protein [Campylobacter curvus]|uniref:phage tail-collar fiber domain-containing protein n=1 Tax=Campylobacter curvus TaxID=200 RepID=UPI0019D31A7F|nr:phage tail protein [Campylobacter curvus]MBN7287913.1 phage tail protein [Campylobacter curvus]
MKQYTLLTANGINKLLKTASDGSKIALKEIVVSDYEGELSEQTTSIPNEKYRGAINAVTIDENDNNILDVDTIIPPEVGGFYIKTAGIYCDDGSLFAVARLADTYKPLLNEGSSKDITLNFKLQIANASESIILKVDNNIVLATRKWCEKMFLKLKDKIDAYTKQESDDKFVAKTDIATEDSAGIFKVTNEITGSRNDVAVTEKAVANNTLSFEPYNKVEVDVFSETNKESTVNVKDIFKDGSCKNFYQFNNNCDEYNNTPRTTANNNISYVEGKFGAAVYYNTPGETYPVVQDTNMFDALGHPTQWTISTWAKADDLTSMANTNYRLWFFGLESNNRSLELRIQTISGQPKLIFGLWGDVQILNVDMSDATSWHNYIVSYNNGVTTIYKDGVSVWTYNKTYEITNGRGSPRANFKGAIDQFRFFNRAITAIEAKTLSEEARSTEKSFISLKGTVYLSDKSSVPGRYLNTAKAIEAKLTKVQQKANGTYFIKVKQDNSLELVDIRPEFHHKSTTAEYYLDGSWYDKTGVRLPPQTYLPYSVIVTSKSITSVNFENIYPSSKELGVGQRWINEKPNRQNNFTYKNETGRSIQISCYVNTVPIQTSQDGINWVSHPSSSTAGECEIIIPAGYFYKTAIVGPQWLELK